MQKSMIMPKHFANFPSEFEAYNPEAIIFDEDNLITVDDDGKYHSYDDKPAFVVNHDKGLIELWWYSHGLPYRENNKPLHVMYGPDFYTTYTIDGMLHSYEEQPAVIVIPTPLFGSEKELDKSAITFEWYRNGAFHRGQDLPALQIVRKNMITSEAYYIEGLKHRPQVTTPSLKKHFAYYSYNSFSNQSEFRQYLYGVSLTENMFNNIMLSKKTEDIPLWVAFFFALGIIDQETMNVVKNQLQDWDQKVPFAWVMRTLNITEEIFQNQIKKATYDNYKISLEKPRIPEPFLVSLGKIVMSDNQEILLKESNNA